MTSYKEVESETLLDMLDKERSKFTKSDKDLMHSMIDELVARGVYPDQKDKRNDPYTMVDGWGAYWHQWKGILNCPHCNADLRDHKAGVPFKREIGLYDRGRDRTTAYQCPDCGKEWPR